MRLTRYWHFRSATLLSSLALGLTLLSQATLACDNWQAELVTADGAVEWQTAADAQWQIVAVSQQICPGSLLRTGTDSRATLRLSNNTIVRLGPGTLLSFPESTDTESFWLTIRNGVARFFSRTRVQFGISAPFVNAAVSGTEFIVWADDDVSGVGVIEGALSASNADRTLQLAAGQSVLADSKTADLQITSGIPTDKVEWSLHFPAVLTVDELQAFPREAEAASVLETAARMLERGQVSQAEQALAAMKSGIPELRAMKLALLSVAASSRGQAATALSLAREGLEAAELPATVIAQSLAWQAASQLNAALKSAGQAVALAPDNILAWLRFAEAQLLVGDLRGARQAVDKALALGPENARGLSLAGLLVLFDHELSDAEDLLKQAVESDPGTVEAHLGLGLLALRQGRAEDARTELDLAISLHPNRSLLRSVLGEVFFAAYQDDRAATQWQLAETLDPLDPTPLFYQGVLQLLNNDPVRALDHFEKARSLDPNRSVIRAPPLMASDSASRTAALARTYRQLGLREQVVNEGYRALRQDPTNAQGHRLLADVYRSQAQLDSASVSELLQAQLWQPLSAYPIPPQLSETDLNIVSGLGPERPGLSEFHPLYLKNGLSGTVGALAGADSTLGNDAVVNYLQGPVSFSLGQYYYDTEGFRDDAEQTQKIYNAFAQWQASADTSLQFEFRRFDWTRGDLRFLADPDSLGTLNADTRTDTWRVGGRTSIAPDQHLLVSAIRQRFTETQADSPAPFVAIDSELEDSPYSLELQHVGHFGEFWTVSGAGTLRSDRDIVATTVQSIPPGPPLSILFQSATRVQQDNAYTYLTAHALTDISLQLGLALNRLTSDDDSDLRQWSPKFGVVYSPAPTLDFRLAAFRTFRREPVAKQTIEPTSIAGFNQFEDDFDTADAKNYGLGVDARTGPATFTGVQLMLRELDFRIAGGNETIQAASGSVREKSAEVYLNHIVNPWLTLSSRLLFDHAHLPYLQGAVGETDRRKTTRLPLAAHLFHQRWQLTLEAEYLRQQTRTSLLNIETLQTASQRGRESVWIGNIALQYRLPRRFGMVEAGIDNVGDVERTIIRSDGDFLQFYPGRFLYGRVQFSF
ncbi:TonB-dependent receptor domain-containing protein [Allohahella marinimesophila]|uniref:FecR family protein n=1 Tax=Allohahella marinimesophila TaxID=1054972 RepID=A0ABP7P7V6_9GAMM